MGTKCAEFGEQLQTMALSHKTMTANHSSIKSHYHELFYSTGPIIILFHQHLVFSYSRLFRFLAFLASSIYSLHNLNRCLTLNLRLRNKLLLLFEICPVADGLWVLPLCIVLVYTVRRRPH